GEGRDGDDALRFAHRAQALSTAVDAAARAERAWVVSRRYWVALTNSSAPELEDLLFLLPRELRKLARRIDLKAAELHRLEGAPELDVFATCAVGRARLARRDAEAWRQDADLRGLEPRPPVFAARVDEADRVERLGDRARGDGRFVRGRLFV